MKKLVLLLLLLTAAFAGKPLLAQECKCNEVKFTITNWICKGKNANGYPVYEGKLTIVNQSKCKFTLTQIMQQAGGDVALTLPITVAPGSTYSNTIVYTDVPPFAGAGSTPYFIVVYNLNNTKCKWEFPSEKLPNCDTKCDCNTGGWQTFEAIVNKVKQKAKCGQQFASTVKTPIHLDGKYICKGNCKAKYIAILKNNVTNVVIQNYNPFTFPWTYSFAAPGNYKLEIIPICGDKKCDPCVFYFTIKKP